MNRTMVPILLSLLAAGCGQDRQVRALRPVSTTSPVVVQQEQEELKFAQPPTRHPVKEGRPPLVYMLEQPAQVQIIDSQDGTVIAQAALGARSIVSVDSAAGVRAGMQQLAPGPLAGAHVYQIFVNTGQDNSYRTGLIRPSE
jgi:hypothetical protein